MQKEVYYLASTEGYDLRQPRKLTVVKRVYNEHQVELILAEIDPVIIGQKYGLMNKDINCVVIAPRYSGDSLEHISKWPFDIHLARLLNGDGCDKEILGDNEIELIAWAELYPTEAAAREAVK